MSWFSSAENPAKRKTSPQPSQAVLGSYVPTEGRDVSPDPTGDPTADAEAALLASNVSVRFINHKVII